MKAHESWYGNCKSFSGNEGKDVNSETFSPQIKVICGIT